MNAVFKHPAVASPERASNPAEGVVRIRFKRKYFKRLSVMFLICGCIGAGLTAVASVLLGAIAYPTVIFALGTGATLWGALAFAALVARNPTALRLDTHGLSGWLVPGALTWDEVAKVGAHEAVLHGTRNSNKIHGIGLQLYDRQAYLWRISAWQRLRHVWPPKPWHIVVRTDNLMIDRQDLLDQVAARVTRTAQTDQTIDAQ